MEKNTMIFGTRAVMEAVRAGREIEKIFIQAGLNNDLIKDLVAEARKNDVPYTFIPQQKLNNLSSKNHQGVICLLAPVSYAKLENLVDRAFSEGRDPFFLVLDRITDVRNFGAICRTAECAGLDGIVISEKGNAPVTADAIKTSAGALNHLPICRSKDLKGTIRFLKESGLRIVACTEKSNQEIYGVSMNSPLALVVGSEEDGIAPDILRLADDAVKIPIKGKVESLNVSVAAGVAIFEAVRQKLR
jgi:23S rRNA (guanosine2251-2'-O)-methyltransferase